MEEIPEIRVLLADDEIPFLNALLRFDWKKYGFVCVETASTGREAYEKCQKQKPHVVITDVNMPVMDGLELMKALKRDFPDILIILLTVHESFSFAQKAVSYGAVGYIVKSMDYEVQLGEALKKVNVIFRDNLNQYSLTQQGLLLSKSGKLIRFPAGGDGGMYEQALSAFITRFGGTLITLRIRTADGEQPPMPAIAESITNLLDHRMDTGAMILPENIVEFLSGRPESDFFAWFGQMKNILASCMCDPNALSAAASAGAVDFLRYRACHLANISTIRNNFYEKRPGLRLGGQVCFRRLPGQLLREWLQQMERLGSDTARVNEYIERSLAPRVRAERYEPDDVKQAFLQMLRQFEMVYASKEDPEAPRQLLAEDMLDGLIIVFLATIRKLLAGDSGYCYEVKTAIIFIKAHLNEPELRLSDVAEHVGISPGYLTKLLREATGEAFRDMVIRTRMEYAGQALKKTNTKIYELANRLGYVNYRSFANAFHKFYGVNPKEFSRQ